MGKNPLQEMLNKLFWDEEINKHEYEIVINDQLEKSSKKSIPFDHIYQIDRFGIDILGSDYIPLHKILLIKKGDQVIWNKSKFTA